MRVNKRWMRPQFSSSMEKKEIIQSSFFLSTLCPRHSLPFLLSISYSVYSRCRSLSYKGCQCICVLIRRNLGNKNVTEVREFDRTRQGNTQGARLSVWEKPIMLVPLIMRSRKESFDSLSGELPSGTLRL
jgi:hypothetical protein